VNSSGGGWRDTDKGQKRIIEDISRLGGMAVKVGILEGAGQVDGVDVAQYAAWNEYGVPGKKKKWKIPPRPFIRGWIDSNEEKVKKQMEQLAGLVVDGKMPPEDALHNLGKLGQDGIQKQMKTGNFIPNSEYTIMRKNGKNKPLFDSGRLYGAISYEVVEGE
jgi:phage gpG-like protein